MVCFFPPNNTSICIVSKKQLVSSAVDIFSFNSVLLFLNSIDLRIDLWKSKRIVNRVHLNFPLIQL